MTPKQFWDEDPDLLWAYWEAYKQNIKEMANIQNTYAFNQGQYFMLAIAECLQFSKHRKKIYPKKPFTLGNGNKAKLSKEEQSEIRKLQFLRMEKEFNKQK